MICPVCEQKLIQAKYADANVRECPKCQGVVLNKSRAEKISRRIDKDIPALFEEIEQATQPDTLHGIRCPGCRVPMKKTHHQTLGIQLDECKSCGISWFDAGELAKLQLEFESREQTVELNSMRERLANMGETERKRYEQRIANLVDLGTPMEQAIREATIELTDYFLNQGFRRGLAE